MPFSDVDIDLFTDVLPGAMLGVMIGTGVEVLAEVNANAFAVVMNALEFPVSTTLEEFSR